MDIKLISVIVVAAAAIGGGAAAFTLMGSSGDQDAVSIDYVLNGGINNADNPDTFIQATVELGDPHRDHYTFGGWFLEDGFENKVSVLDSSDGDATVYAKWTPVVYSISYDLGGEAVTNTNPVSGTVEDSIVLADLSSEGVTFDGWFTSGSFDQANKVSQLTPESDMTLYAKWTLIQYGVDYVLGGGINNAANPASFTRGTLELADPHRDHYTFGGWFLEDGFENKVSVLDSSDGDATVYAKWTPVVYSISYDLGGEAVTNTNPVSGTVEDSIVLGDLSSEGVTFDGWFTSGSFDQADKVSQLTPESDMTLYAKWLPIYHDITYVLGKDWATNVNPPKVSERDSVVLVDPECTGMDFGGWYTSGGFEAGTEISSFTPKANMSIYAKWTPIDYPITYNNVHEGLNDNPAKATIEDVVTLNNPISPSRVFAGWYTTETFDSGSEVVSFSPSSAVSLYAKWDTIEGHELLYAVTVDVEGVKTSGYIHYMLADASDNGYLRATSTVLYYPFSLSYLTVYSYDSSWPEGGEAPAYTITGSEEVETFAGVKTLYGVNDGESTAWIAADGLPYVIISDSMTAVLQGYDEVDVEDTVSITVYTGTGVTVTGFGSYALGEHVTLTASVAEGVEFQGYASGTVGVIHKDAVWEFDASESMVIFALPEGEYALYERGAEDVKWTVTDDRTGLTVAAPSSNPAIITASDGGSYTVTMVGKKDGQAVIDTRDLTTGLVFVNTYQWSYKYGILSTLKGNMQWTGYLSDYVYFKHLNTDMRNNIPYDKVTSFVMAGDSVVVSIKDYLNEEAKNLTSLQKANYVLKFVQESITYVTDVQGKGADEYWKYPYETLFDKYGDCEDKSILYASIMKAMGYDVALIYLPGHMAVGVAGIDGATGTYIEYGDKQYFYCETTDPDSELGEWPEDLEKVINNIFPVE